ncbi:MAG: hypothetical protein DVB26_00880 [Verrucomicrobia bacterium]|nr:MAG: hypothetical protein DVB26_00880 [Verrucomicrobiota bacterium]
MLPLLAFAVSNLWLASPWAREWLAAKIQQRCGGLPIRVGGASWSPWHGVTLHHLVVAQPAGLGYVPAEPLLRITSLRLIPRWQACWHGHFVVQSADLEEPRLVGSLQMLSHLAQPAPEPTPPLAAAQPAAPAMAAQSPKRPSPLQVSPPPNPLPPATPNSQQPHAPAAAAAAVAEVPQPTAWIRLRHGSLRLVAGGSAPPLVELADLSGELPVAGAAAVSSLRLASLIVHGSPVLSDFTAPLTWQAPVLSLNPVDANLMGIHLQLAAKLGLLAGLPIQLEVQVPSQSPAPLTLAGAGEIKTAHLASSGRFRGLLLAPGTWQGDCLAESSAISIHVGEHRASFDSGSCSITLRGGILSCLDARLIGEELSLLGNATLLADGRAAGVARLVAAPETTLGILKRLFPDVKQAPTFTPLTSPQRVACDLEVSGSIAALQLRLGHNGPLVQP